MNLPNASPLSRLLGEKRTLILDGALATELERAGHDLNHKLWSARVLLEYPDAIRDVHLEYAGAGADILTTASYQASWQGLHEHGISSPDIIELLAASVTLAQEAAECRVDPPLVAASVGPYGAYLANGGEFRGNYGISRAALREFHRPRLEVLAASTADLIAFETLPSFAEAEALAELLTTYPEKFAWFSFSCRDGAHINEGTPIEQCARLLDAHPGVTAIGINCSAPSHLPELIRRLADSTDLPVIVYPNSGEIFDSRTRSWSGTANSGDFATAACEWADAGASIIGGCCRTTPGHIRSLKQHLDKPAVAAAATRS